MAVNRKDYELFKEGIYRHKANDRKYLFRTYDGKREKNKVYTVTGDKTKKEIERDVSIAFANFLNVEADKPQTDITLDDLYQLYRETKPKTTWQLKKIKYYNLYIKDAIGSKKIKDLQKRHIDKIKVQMGENGLKERTVKLVNEVLIPVFDFAVDNRIIKQDERPKIEHVKVPSQKKPVTQAAQKVQQIYDAIYELYGENPMFRALFLIWLFLAKRKTETLLLKWEHIDFENNFFWLTSDTTKTSDNQKYWLPAEIKEALLEFRENKGYVFKNYDTGKPISNIYRQVQKIKSLAGVPEFTPHYCRNLLVSAAHDEGVESAQLSGALGHNDANTINEYLTINHLRGSKATSEAVMSIVKK